MTKVKYRESAEIDTNQRTEALWNIKSARLMAFDAGQHRVGPQLCNRLRPHRLYSNQLNCDFVGISIFIGRIIQRPFFLVSRYLQSHSKSYGQAVTAATQYRYFNMSPCCVEFDLAQFSTV